ncbi:hypothetical protein EPN52_04895 [bacterium]|nr:MAG: hypothetical protein EPN52_04895 [bacterium]
MAGVRELFGRSWRLYRENPILAVPALLLQGLGLLIALSAALARQPEHDLSRAALVLAFVALWLVIYFVGGNYLTAAAFGMSAAAWRVDLATLADGVRAGARRWWALATLWFLIVGVGTLVAVATYLVFAAAVPSEPARRAIVTHPSAALRAAVIAVALVFWFFTIYTVPAIVVGGRRALDGFVRSVTLARKRARETVVMVIPLALVGGLLFLGGSALDGVVAHQPWTAALAQIAAAIVEGLWGAYVTLVVTGRFLQLEDSSPQGLPAETMRPIYE